MIAHTGLSEVTDETLVVRCTKVEAGAKASDAKIRLAVSVRQYDRGIVGRLCVRCVVNRRLLGRFQFNEHI